MSLGDITIPGGSYVMVGPDGRIVKIDKRVFEAFRDMIDSKKQGAVTTQFLSGGIRAVRAEHVYS